VRALLASASASDVNSVDADSNKLPLYVACEDGNAKLVALLLSHGADASLPCTRAQSTPLHAAAYYSHAALVHELVVNGRAHANVANANGITPLHAACSTAHLDTVRALLANGALSATCADRLGATPLHYAAAQLQPTLVEAILAADKRAASVRDKAGLEPAHYAAADAGSADAEATKRNLPKVLELLAGAGSASAKTSVDALKRALQDAPEPARRHIGQVARRDVPSQRSQRVAASARAPAAPSPVAPVPKIAVETPMATNSNADDVLSQMPSVPGLRKPPKRSDGPEEYADLFDQRGSLAPTTAPNAADVKLVFLPGQYQEVAGAALPMLGVEDSPPASPSMGKITAKLRNLRKKDDSSPASAESATPAALPEKKESISQRMKRLKDMAREKLSGHKHTATAAAAASTAGAPEYSAGDASPSPLDNAGDDDDADQMSFPEAPEAAASAIASSAAVDVPPALDEFPEAPQRAAPQRRSVTGLAPVVAVAAAEDDDEFEFPEAPTLDSAEDELAFPDAPTVALPSSGGKNSKGGGGGGGGGASVGAPKKAAAPTMSEERMRELAKAKLRADKADQALRSAQQSDADKERSLQARLAKLQPAGAQPADPRGDAQQKKAAQDEFLRQVSAYRAANVAHAEKKRELARRKAALERGDFANARKNPAAMPVLPSVPSDLPSEPAVRPNKAELRTSAPKPVEPPKATPKPVDPVKPSVPKAEPPKKSAPSGEKKAAVPAAPAPTTPEKSAEELARERKEQKRFEKFLAENDPDYEASDDELDESVPKMTNKELNALLKQAAAEMDDNEIDSPDAAAVAAKYAAMFANLAAASGTHQAKSGAKPSSKPKALPAVPDLSDDADVDNMDEEQLLKFVHDAEKHDAKILDAMSRFNDRV
jgi:hypothetical protein